MCAGQHYGQQDNIVSAQKDNEILENSNCAGEGNKKEFNSESKKATVPLYNYHKMG